MQKETIMDFSNVLMRGEDIRKMYPIPGIVEVYPIYYITSYGRVFSEYRGVLKELALSPNSNNYLAVRFKKGPGPGVKSYQIDRLVLIYFGNTIPLNIKELEANHKDRNILNNRIDNLEWVTHQENMKHYSDNYREVNYMTSSKIDNVLEMLNKGYTSYEIHQQLGVPINIIHIIKRGIYDRDIAAEEKIKINFIDDMNVYIDIVCNGLNFKQAAFKYNVREDTIIAIYNNVCRYREVKIYGKSDN